MSEYRIAPLMFYIGGALAPVSVRDQLTRGCGVVDALCEEGLIQGAQRPLLVVGGGAAGMTAAIRAAQLEVEVTVVEHDRDWYLLQRECSSRWISPTLYDWPADHWPSNTWPHKHDQVPLDYTEGIAEQVAIAWDRRIAELPALVSQRIDMPKRRVVVGRPTLVTSSRKRYRRAIVSRCDEKGNPTDAPIARHSVDFGAILIATGLGEEVTWLTRGTFHGFSFWRTPSTLARTRVLISGGGDGALQDFVLHATRLKETRTLFALLRQSHLTPDQELSDALTDVRAGQGIPNIEPAWMSLEHAIGSAETDAEEWRIGSGSTSKASTEEQILEALDNAYASAVDTFLEDPGVKGFVVPLLRRLLWTNREVTLVHSRKYFTWCYPINRFLVHLIRRIASPGASFQTKLQVISLTSVSSAHCESEEHTCLGSPEECCEHAHVVTLRPSGQQITADMIILRHGISRPTHVLGMLTPPPRYQRLPYTL